jgi:hypothetical protein
VTTALYLDATDQRRGGWPHHHTACTGLNSGCAPWLDVTACV